MDVIIYVATVIGQERGEAQIGKIPGQSPDKPRKNQESSKPK